MRKTIAIILSVAALGLNGRAENKVDFAKSVQGIFEARCIDCHGSKKQKGDLRLDSQEAALAEVIKPGKSGESELYKHISLPADAEQRTVAVVDEKAPADIITKADRKARRLEPLGLAASEMNKKQFTQLWTLIEEYLRNYRLDLAEEGLKHLEGLDLKMIHFAWAGSLESGKGHYYRIQAPDFLIEYDNTQNGANHVHCVVRDLKRDFGEDLLRQHYEQHHKK